MIPVKTRQRDQTLIMPVGDIQWAGDKDGVALGMLKRHIQWGVEHDALFLGMGDYIDFMSPSNRDRYSGAGIYNTSKKAIERKVAEKLVEEVYEEALAPSKGRWLGLLEGHHFFPLSGGMTTDMLLADKLQTRHLGSAAYVRLMFQRHGDAHSVLLWAHHGTGTGQTPAAILNKLKAIAGGFDGDIFLMGHLPKKVAEVTDKLVPVFPSKGRPYLVHRTKIFAGTGGFMKGYVEGRRDGIVPRGEYPEQGMMPPAALGGILVKVRPRWKQIEGRSVWMPDLNVEV